MKFSFRFVINRNIKNRLKTICISQNKSMSDLILLIIDRMDAILDRKHLTEPNNKARYPQVEGDTSIKFKMKEHQYHKIKQMHDQLNTFSMAVIIRELIDILLGKMEDKDFQECLDDIEKESAKFKQIVSKKKMWKKGHMSFQLHHLSYFNSNYELIQIKLLL